MAITTKVSTAERILIIDPGKYKSVACVGPPARPATTSSDESA